MIHPSYPPIMYHGVSSRSLWILPQSLCFSVVRLQPTNSCWVEQGRIEVIPHDDRMMTTLSLFCASRKFNVGVGRWNTSIGKEGKVAAIAPT